MKRLPKLSLAAVLCITLLLSSSALAARPAPQSGKVNVVHVSWLERAGSFLHNLFVDLFGGGIEVKPPVHPADDGSGPSFDDGSGRNHPDIGSITRDDGWLEQL